MQRKHYDGAFKGKIALELVKGLRTVNEIASDYGLHPTMIMKWKKQLLEGIPGIFSNQQSQVKKDKKTEELISRLYQKIGQLEVELEWIKKNLSSSPEHKGQLIEKDNPKISICRQCELLGIARSSYYYEPAKESDYNLRLMRLIDEEYTKHPFYGVPRMTEWLKHHDYQVNHKRIERLMKKMGLQGICPKRNMSKSTEQHIKYPYLLRGLKIDHPNQVWCSDITYIRLMNGFVYLVAIMDWYSRYVLSWEISNTLDTSFCLEALDKALYQRKPEIFNTDQGSQFTSKLFTSRLENEQIRISMDGRGRFFDNIFIERLWRTVKYEEVYLKDYETVYDVVTGIGDYFNFYNNERLHKSLNNRAPSVSVYVRHSSMIN